MSTTVLGDQYVTVGVGTTAQRPTPTAGMIRYNTNLDRLEMWDTTEWNSIAVQTVYNILTVDTNGNLIHQEVIGGEANTSVNAEDALCAFFSNRITMGIDTSGNLTITY